MVKRCKGQNSPGLQPFFVYTSKYTYLSESLEKKLSVLISLSLAFEITLTESGLNICELSLASKLAVGMMIGDVLFNESLDLLQEGV